MKPQTILLACLAFAACGLALGSEFQPVQAGIAPLKSRLAEVKAESVSLRTALAAAEPAERPRSEGQLAALQEEEKQLTAEIDSAERQSRSPYVTYAAPPQHQAR
ncbi:hypothetical protein [Rhodoferax sp.]|uniref:hypothetical protein n=1 Tax=Rhodoferax sp. TaxID=50421 RepID=UPI002616733C|nr:hypothetical protein [Rhodoferax sp.]MDD2925980.1 hypothetical protein [Rhodoferax sp.]